MVSSIQRLVSGAYGLTTKPDYVSNHSHVVMLDRVTNWTKHTSILSDALDALKDEHVAIHGSDHRCDEWPRQARMCSSRCLSMEP